MAIRGDTTGAERHYLLDMLSAGGDALEIGCGDGRLTRVYAGLARRVVGIDPRVESLRLALQSGNAKNARFVQASGTALPFRAASFDQAIFALSL